MFFTLSNKRFYSIQYDSNHLACGVLINLTLSQNSWKQLPPSADITDSFAILLLVNPLNSFNIIITLNLRCIIVKIYGLTNEFINQET